eukprot:SAG31_NODE_11691_length_1006_cov_1.467475_2_plen_96_part_00
MNGAANIFKVATEITLTVTLTFATMLRFDLSKEDVGPDFIGVILCMCNLIGPSVGLLWGIGTEGFTFERELVYVDEDDKMETEIQNPSESNDDTA